MTDRQAEQIRLMRQDGMGYKAIALNIGLSRDIVRNFCKKNEMAGYGAALKLNIEEQKKIGRVCLFCGKAIDQPITGRHKKFCSDICRRKWWSEHQDRLNKSDTALYKLSCKRCGAEFISYGNKSRKYCSHECYIRKRFWEVEDENSGIESAACGFA